LGQNEATRKPGSDTKISFAEELLLVKSFNANNVKIRVHYVKN